MKNYTLISRGAISLLMLVFIFSCQKRTIDDASNEVKALHQVTGKVLAKNGKTPVANASVFVDNKGDVYFTTTNEKGDFNLKTPEGKHTLNIQTGGGHIFRTEMEIEVIANEVNNVNKSNQNNGITLLQAGSLAYIVGYYDAIENIIVDSLGYTATEIFVSDLNSLTTMQQYSAIFLNCGKSGTMDSTKYHNIENYVKAGGSIYASDYAVNYLTGDGFYKTSPHSGKNEKIENHSNHNHLVKSGPCSSSMGGFIPDTELCTDKTGSATTLNGASIVALDIQNALGKSSLDIYYNLGSWEVINVWNQWEVLIQDNGTYGPLAIRRNLSNSNSSATNTNDNKVTICHIPPGNPGNPQTITISVNALQYHLNHGCSVGTCSGTGGNMYYTTFHNKHNGTISQDVQKILEYFILNL